MEFAQEHEPSTAVKELGSLYNIFESSCSFKSLLVVSTQCRKMEISEEITKRKMAMQNLKKIKNRELKRRSASLSSDEARTGERNVVNAVHQVENLKNNRAERDPKQNRKGKKRKKNGRINSIFSVHHVSLILPVDPGPVHMSARLHAYVSTIT